MCAFSLPCNNPARWGERGTVLPGGEGWNLSQVCLPPLLAPWELWLLWPWCFWLWQIGGRKHSMSRKSSTGHCRTCSRDKHGSQEMGDCIAHCLPRQSSSSWVTSLHSLSGKSQGAASCICSVRTHTNWMNQISRKICQFSPPLELDLPEVHVWCKPFRGDGFEMRSFSLPAVSIISAHFGKSWAVLTHFKSLNALQGAFPGPFAGF